ncbi:MAG: hypothetical protein ACXVS6_22690 [Solirubrobacteraceae bacterium]
MSEKRDRLAEAMERWVALGERQEAERRLQRAKDELRGWLAQVGSDPDDPPPKPPGRSQGRPRGSTPIPLELAERLDVEIRQHHKNPESNHHTYGAIIARIERDYPALPVKARGLVQRAVRLMEKRWPLTESDPDFRARTGFVSWPNPKRALQLLGSRRVRRARPL